VTARIPRSLLFVGVAALMTIVALNAERLAKRVTEELNSVDEVVSGEMQDVSASSFGLRWNAQRFGLNAWLERPLLGWGAETSRPLIRASEDAKLNFENGDSLKHLHNTYLEILVQFGLIGFVLFGLLIVLLWRGIARAQREGRIPADYGVYLIALLVLTLVWCLFDYRAVHQDWRIYWTLLAGTALSFALPAQALAQARRPPTEEGPI
jgi:O-antigen ligase